MQPLYIATQSYTTDLSLLLNEAVLGHPITTTRTGPLQDLICRHV